VLFRVIRSTACLSDLQEMTFNSPDNSPDEASPGGLARPLESIGRGSSKEGLIIVVHPL